MTGPLPYTVIARTQEGSERFLGMFADLDTARANRDRYAAGLSKAGQEPCTYAIYRAEWHRVDYMEQKP